MWDYPRYAHFVCAFLYHCQYVSYLTCAPVNNTPAICSFMPVEKTYLFHDFNLWDNQHSAPINIMNNSFQVYSNLHKFKFLYITRTKKTYRICPHKKSLRCVLVFSKFGQNLVQQTIVQPHSSTWEEKCQIAYAAWHIMMGL